MEWKALNVTLGFSNRQSFISSSVLSGKPGRPITGPRLARFRCCILKSRRGPPPPRTRSHRHRKKNLVRGRIDPSSQRSSLEPRNVILGPIDRVQQVQVSRTDARGHLYTTRVSVKSCSPKSGKISRIPGVLRGKKPARALMADSPGFTISGHYSCSFFLPLAHLVCLSYLANTPSLLPPRPVSITERLILRVPQADYTTDTVPPECM